MRGTNEYLPTRAAGKTLVWTPHGPEIIGDNPLLRPCPFCAAPIGSSCTLGRRGRRVRTATHSERFSQLTAHTGV
jgi:hypothetical protein